MQKTRSCASYAAAQGVKVIYRNIPQYTATYNYIPINSGTQSFMKWAIFLGSIARRYSWRSSLAGTKSLRQWWDRPWPIRPGSLGVSELGLSYPFSWRAFMFHLHRVHTQSVTASLGVCSSAAARTSNSEQVCAQPHGYRDSRYTSTEPFSYGKMSVRHDL